VPRKKPRLTKVAHDLGAKSSSSTSPAGAAIRLIKGAFERRGTPGGTGKQTIGRIIAIALSEIRQNVNIEVRSRRKARGLSKNYVKQKSKPKNQSVGLTSLGKIYHTAWRENEAQDEKERRDNAPLLIGKT